MTQPNWWVESPNGGKSEKGERKRRRSCVPWWTSRVTMATQPGEQETGTYRICFCWDLHMWHSAAPSQRRSEGRCVCACVCVPLWNIHACWISTHIHLPDWESQHITKDSVMKIKHRRTEGGFCRFEFSAEKIKRGPYIQKGTIFSLHSSSFFRFSFSVPLRRSPSACLFSLLSLPLSTGPV